MVSEIKNAVEWSEPCQNKVIEDECILTKNKFPRRAPLQYGKHKGDLICGSDSPRHLLTALLSYSPLFCDRASERGQRKGEEGWSCDKAAGVGNCRRSFQRLQTCHASRTPTHQYKKRNEIDWDKCHKVHPSTETLSVKKNSHLKMVRSNLRKDWEDNIESVQRKWNIIMIF